MATAPYPGKEPPPQYPAGGGQYPQQSVQVQQTQVIQTTGEAVVMKAMIMDKQWQNDLCGCFNNCGICIVTFLCPCYTFGKNAEALGESCFLCAFLMCCIPQVAFGPQVALRVRLREMRGVQGSLVSDVVLAACCGYCTLCQEAQEIRTMKEQQETGLQVMHRT